MDPSLVRRVDAADGVAELFGIAKDLVQSHLGRSRGGVMVGLARLGFSPAGWVGGYFVTGTNAIVLNRDLLDYVRVQAPDHERAYVLHLLLHEYLHTLGFLEEARVRRLVHEIVRDALGGDHPVTRIADAMRPGGSAQGLPAELREVLAPRFARVPRAPGEMTIVRGVDPDATPYIA